MKDTTRGELIYRLQRGLPLSRRPFAALGAELRLDEADVLDELHRVFESGGARRLGAVFDSRRLGYRSALAAVSLGPEHRDEVVSRFVAIPGITHCYHRGWPPELDPSLPGAPGGEPLPDIWFALTGRDPHFEEDLERIRTAVSPAELFLLPATRRFKVDVVFNTTGEPVTPPAPGNDRADFEDVVRRFKFGVTERQVVRVLQGHLPLVPAPYDEAASRTKLAPDALLALLRRWHEAGIVRRVALILRHRKMGFTGNGMCIWSVEEDRITELGRVLAQRPEITHCYQRPAFGGFLSNLYAMIHTRSLVGTCNLFKDLSQRVGLPRGRVLFSLTEYKKTSPRYFDEERNHE